MAQVAAGESSLDVAPDADPSAVTEAAVRRFASRSWP
jgi:hypothetical protein